MNPDIVIQARTGSKRLPGKVLAKVAGGKTVLEYVILRCRQARNVSRIIVATTDLPADRAVAELACSLGVLVFCGDELDVLLRYVKTCREFKIKVLVRITADCPLIDPSIIDEVIERYRKKSADYVFTRNYPNGLGAAELMTRIALERSASETTMSQTYYREHVMTYMLDHPEKFSLGIEDAPIELRKPAIHLSVDEPDDLELVRRIASHFYPRTDFSTADILNFLSTHPDLEALSRRRVDGVKK